MFLFGKILFDFCESLVLYLVSILLLYFYRKTNKNKPHRAVAAHAFNPSTLENNGRSK